MRATLQEQWDRLIAALEIKKREHLSKVLREHPRPSVIYSLESHKSIQELHVDDAVVFVNIPSLKRDRPTRKAVAALQAVVEGFNPTKADAFYCYHYSTDYGRVEGWLKVSDFIASDRHALSREELLPKQQELIEKYAPRDGYKPCDYCATQRPIAELKPRKIFAQQYPGGYKTGLYCADEGCGGYDQMAHEG